MKSWLYPILLTAAYIVLFVYTSGAQAAEVTELQSYSLKGSELRYSYSVPSGCEKHVPRVRVELKRSFAEIHGKTVLDMKIHIEDSLASVDACADANEPVDVSSAKNLKAMVDRGLKRMHLTRDQVFTRLVLIRPNRNLYGGMNGLAPKWEPIRGYSNREFLP
jgi:hypothetical protein